MGYIYMLTDTGNDKKYIGQHNGSIKSYWSGGLIPNRIADVYGKEIFERVILEGDILNEDLGENRLKKLIPKDILSGFNKLRDEIKTKNIKKRSLIYKGFKHSDKSKQKISDKRKKEFLEYCNSIYKTMIDKNTDYLVDCFNKHEYPKIRKKIKSSKFSDDIPENIKDKILKLKPSKKVFKVTYPNKVFVKKT